MSNRYLDARANEGWEKTEYSLFQAVMDIRKDARAIAGDPLMLLYLKRDRDILVKTIAEIEAMGAVKEAV